MAVDPVCGAPVAGDPKRLCKIPPHAEHVPHTDSVTDDDYERYGDPLSNDPEPEQDQIYRGITT